MIKSLLFFCILFLLNSLTLTSCHKPGSSGNNSGNNSGNSTANTPSATSSAKDILEFSINKATGTIVGQNISLIMPYGTNLAKLIATFNTTGQSVTIAGVNQVSGQTSNDFNNGPVTYTVVAADGSSSIYTVNVTSAKNSAKEILAFSLNKTTGTIVGQNISFIMPYETHITSLIATFNTTGQKVTIAGVDQVSGQTSNDFSNGPVPYTVVAADGSSSIYNVNVTTAKNPAKDILTFSLNGTAGTITGQNISFIMPYRTNATSLIATFNTTGQKVTIAGVNQVSGQTSNDFSNGPVTYTVLAADDSSIRYNISAIVDRNSPIVILADGVTTDVRGHIGGTLYTADQNKCNSHFEVLIGFQGNMGASLNQIQAICASLSFSADAKIVSNLTTVTSLRGNNAGSTSWKTVCPQNSVVVGFTGNSGLLLDKINLMCSSLSFVPGNLPSVAVNGSILNSSSAGGYGGSPFAPLKCPNGQIASAAVIRAGNNVNALGLKCSSVLLSTPR